MNEGIDKNKMACCNCGESIDTYILQANIPLFEKYSDALAQHMSN